MSEVQIRMMEKADLEKICEIEKENFSIPWSEKSFMESMMREDTVFLTAVCGGEIAGYLGCYCIDGAGEITNVAVGRNFRRKGIASQLLERLFEEGARLGTMEYFLEVRESNEPAIALYRTKGFAGEGIRKNFYEKPTENAVIMWRH